MTSPLVVLITGCSSGFGRAAAIAFAEAGHTVVATMRNLAKADGLGDGVDDLRVLPLDVADERSRRDAVAATLDQHGRVDVLVNNAGVSALGPAEEMTDETARSMFEANFWGAYGMIREVLPSMRERSAGRIVSVTSIGGLMATGFYSTYCATKHALDALALGLDIELQQWGIRSVVVAPGGFNTSIVANRVPFDQPDSIYARAVPAIREYEERMATGRDDLNPVTDAIIEAATALEPRARYLIGSGTTDMLIPVVAEGEKIHAVLRARDAV